jgi:hypothetical protein
MTTERDQEIALCNALRRARKSFIRAVLAQPYGVLIIRNDLPSGLWSYYKGQFQYRKLANHDPIATFLTLDEVVKFTHDLYEK